VPVEPVCAGVVCVAVDVVWLGCVVAVVCEAGGVFATVTVFVPEPHAASSSAAAHPPSAIENPRRPPIRLILTWYSPLPVAFLALQAAR
jgi:hypothetical protein